MTSEQSEIPLAIDDEIRADSPVRHNRGRRAGSQDVARIRAIRSAGRPDESTHRTDRRMEEWIASNLDLVGPGADTRPRSPWIRLIDGLPGMKRPPRREAPGKRHETSMLGWSRFHVAYKRGVTVVRLLDKDAGQGGSGA